MSWCCKSTIPITIAMKRVMSSRSTSTLFRKQDCCVRFLPCGKLKKSAAYLFVSWTQISLKIVLYNIVYTLSFTHRDEYVGNSDHLPITNTKWTFPSLFNASLLLIKKQLSDSGYIKSKELFLCNCCLSHFKDWVSGY